MSPNMTERVNSLNYDAKNKRYIQYEQQHTWYKVTVLLLIMDSLTRLMALFSGKSYQYTSNSKRKLQVQIPWHYTLAMLGKNMLHSTAHLLHRYGAAQLLLNVYSLGNWLHPVKVTSSCCCKDCCSSSTTLVTFLSQSAHPNPDNISITLQAQSKHLSRLCVLRLGGCVHKNKGVKQPRHPTLTSCSGADAFGAHVY